ncbi:hypothetical protein H4Q26_006390 [Puccinia striiformis f. sp. tritici PST-130]|nr:hypothetical protein H4Q26_006390 [Puccinia striiformis f. sp. tritici PST-130]
MDNIDLGGEDGEPRNSALNIELLMPYFDSADASMYELRVGQLMRFLLRNFTRKRRIRKRQHYKILTCSSVTLLLKALKER